MGLTAILIDDERNSREALRKKLISNCPGVSIVAECSDGEEGLAAINAYSADIVFLDIEMPRMNGLVMLQKLQTRPFEVIFTTAYNQYAIDAIKASAIDYLVKPVDVRELVQAVEKVNKHRQQLHNKQLEVLESWLSGTQNKIEKIAVSTSAGFEIIPLEQIVFLEAISNYTHIHLVHKRVLVASKTLKEFEDILPVESFCRIHNASLVNVTSIVKYIKGDGGQVILSDGAILDVARRRKDELLQKIRMGVFKI